MDELIEKFKSVVAVSSLLIGQQISLKEINDSPDFVATLMGMLADLRKQNLINNATEAMFLYSGLENIVVPALEKIKETSESTGIPFDEAEVRKRMITGNEQLNAMHERIAEINERAKNLGN